MSIANTSIALILFGIVSIADLSCPFNIKKLPSVNQEKKLAPVNSCSNVICCNPNLNAVATVDHIATASKAYMTASLFLSNEGLHFKVIT